MKKTLYILSAILLVIIISFIITINIFLSEEKIREYVIKPVEKKTGLVINIKKIDAGIWGGVHVDLNGILIIDTTYTHYPYLLKSGNVRAYLPLSFLYSDEYILEEFLVDSADLKYELTDKKLKKKEISTKNDNKQEDIADNNNDFSDLKFLLPALSLKNSKISIFTGKGKQEIQLEGLNQNSKLVLDTGYLSLESKTSINHLKIYNNNGLLLNSVNDKLELNLGFDTSNNSLKISNSHYNILNIPGEIEVDMNLNEGEKSKIKVYGNNVKIDQIIKNIDPELIELISDIKGELNYELNILPDKKEIKYNGKLNITNGKLSFKDPSARIEKINSSISFNNKRLLIKDTRISAEGQSLIVNAKLLKGIKTHDIDAKITLNADFSKLSKFNKLLPDLFQFSSGKVLAKLNIKDKLDINHTISSKSININKIPNFYADVEFLKSNFVTKIQKKHNFQINGKIKADKNRINISKTQINDELNSYFFSIKLDNYFNLFHESLSKKANMTGQVVLGRLKANHYLIEEKPANNKAKAIEKSKNEKKKPALNNFAILSKLDMNLDLSAEEVTYDKLKLNKLISKIRNKNNRFNADISRLKLYEGFANGKLNLNYSKLPLEVTINYKLDKFNSNQAFTEIADIKNKIFGALKSDGFAKFLLDDTLGVISKSILANLKLNIRNGKLANIEAIKELGKTLKVFNFDTLYLDSWTYGAIIKDELVSLKDSDIKGKDYRLISKSGTIKFNKSMKIPVVIQISKSKSAEYSSRSDKFIKQLIPYLRNKSGEIEIETEIIGKVNSPDIKLKWDKAQKRFEDDAKKKIEKKAKDLLKNLFN